MRSFQTLALSLLFLGGASAAQCNRDNCLRAVAATPTKASSFCAAYTKSANTATTAFPSYASACTNSPSRVSSACSCVVTSPPSCTPSTVIQGPTRNGGFDSYAIPPASGPKSQPPWYYDRLTKAYGDFQYEEPGSSAYGDGAAAFHLNGTAAGQFPGAVAYLNNPVTFCNGTTYAFSFYVRQTPYYNYVNYQDCRISIFTEYEGTILSVESGANYITDQFSLAGPVERKVFRDNGAVNAKGEYSDLLSVVVQCLGRPGVQYPVDTLVEVDSVAVEVAG